MVTAAVLLSDQAGWTDHFEQVAQQAGLLPLDPTKLLPGQPFVLFSDGASLSRATPLLPQAAAQLKGLVLVDPHASYVLPDAVAHLRPRPPTLVLASPEGSDWPDQTQVVTAPLELMPATAHTGLWARGHMLRYLTSWQTRGQWLIRVANEMQFLRAYHLRTEVFVEEQGVPLNEELDAKDPISEHLILTSEGVIVATGRLTRLGQGKWYLGRIVVRADRRGQHLGQAVVRGLEQLATARTGPHFDVVALLDAQMNAASFYEQLGYQLKGPIFMDGGIEHLKARKLIRPAE